MSIATEIQRLQTAKADIKSAIEEKGVTVGDGLLDTYADKVREISVGGGEGINLGNYCTHIEFAVLNYFGTPEVTLNLPEVKNMEYLCQMPITQANGNTTVEHITINCPYQVASARCLFGADGGNIYDTKLKRITLNVDTSKCTSFYNAFKNVRVLEVIDGTPLDLSSVIGTNAYPSLNGMFDFAYALKEVRFVEKTIKRNISFAQCGDLSDLTVQSAIDGLADLTGGTARTLTLHATVGGKLTDEQKASITAKNWALVY